MATWVSAVSGPVLVRIAASCDVEFYADSTAGGCAFSEDGQDVHCPDGFGASLNPSSVCASELELTVTEGAYFTPEQKAELEAVAEHPLAPLMAALPQLGQAVQEQTVEVPGPEVEAMVATMFSNLPPAEQAAHGGAAPTLEAMLIPGSPEAALMARTFTSASDGSGAVRPRRSSWHWPARGPPVARAGA